VTYEFRSESSGKVTRARGSALLKQMVIALPASRMSDILVYRKAAR
jgi:hypothetical protein